MNIRRTVFFFTLLSLTGRLAASEIQHVLRGLFEFYLFFTLIGAGINVLMLFLYHRTKNKWTARLLLVLAGMNLFVGFQLFTSSFDGLAIFGMIFLSLGIYTALQPLKKYLSFDKEEDGEDSRA